MKILLLHLSDAHISSKKDVNILKLQKLVDSLNIIDNFDECILIFSGDLANKGKYDEYTYVKYIFGNIIAKIKKKYTHIKKIEKLVVPGNHDIDHTKKENSRNDIYEYLKNNTIDDQIDNEIEKMNCFFNFANTNNCFKENKIIDKKYFNFNGYKIVANLLNSALFSVKRDEKGIHYLPNRFINKLYNNEDADLYISILHHGPSWFAPQNQNDLEKALYKNSSMVFIGHDHHKSENNMKINNEYKVDVIYGGAFSNSHNIVSEFNAIEINTETNKYNTYFFTWNEEGRCYTHRILSESKNIIKIGMNPLDTFLNKLVIDEKHKLSDKFTDYFVFPRLIKQNKDKDLADYELYEHNNFLEKLESIRRIIIFGDDNSGKTTLLKSLYLLLSKDKIPLFFNIEDIKNKSIDKIIKNVFEEQYSQKETEYINFQQMGANKKVALVDDIHLIHKKSLKSFISNLNKKFEYIILCGKKGWNFDISNEVKEDLDIFESFDKYEILDFYSNKRLELIEKICKICQPVNITNINDYARKINNFIHNQIKLFNLNPDFIIQYTKYFCDNSNSNSSTNKIFSKVFEANIVKSIELHSKKNCVDKIFTILDRIAYYIHFNQRYPLSIAELNKIIEEYNKAYGQDIKSRELVYTLCESKIVKCDDTFNIKFSNNSFLAFFVARELMRKYNEGNDSEDLDYVLKYICFGINSDIVLFISYLSNNIKVLQYIYSSANDYMNDWNELCIDKNNINFLKAINSNLKIDLPDKNDKKIVKELETKQEKEFKDTEMIRTIDIYNYCEDDIDLLMNKLTKSFKYTQIISRILPSFEHLLKMEEKNKFVKAIYSFPNKILYYWLNIIDENIEEITNEISQLIRDNQHLNDNVIIKEKTNMYLEDLITAMILSIYDHIGILATNSETIKFLENFSYSNNSNYEIQNLLMHESLNNIDKFIYKFHHLYDKSNNHLVKIMIMKVVRKYLLTHKNIRFDKKQKLIGNYFSKRDKKRILYEKRII